MLPRGGLGRRGLVTYCGHAITRNVVTSRICGFNLVRVSVIRERSPLFRYGRRTDPGQWEAGMDALRKFWHRRVRSDSLGHDDELEHTAVGDPDPTSEASTAQRSRRCGFEWLDASSQPLVLRWSCTRELGHRGQHLAGTGQDVAAVHPPLLRYPDAASCRVLGPTRSTPVLASRAVPLCVPVMQARLTADRHSQLPC